MVAVYHVPVLLREVIKNLKVATDGKYIDATVGGGGHAEAVLKKGGLLLGIDRDPQAISAAGKRLGGWIRQKRAILRQANFERIKEIAVEQGWKTVDGVLFDLGMSSGQVGDPNRGFSFRADGPLDMRMEPELGVTAADLVNALPEKELGQLFRSAGERKAGLVARGIVERRMKKKFETTADLAEFISRLVPGRGKPRKAAPRGKLHPATKVFMALRMAVNDELGNLSRALPRAVELLGQGGRLVVISFHEGEDRLVKNYLRTEELLRVINKKPIVASGREVLVNPRSRSAKMRVGEKL